MTIGLGITITIAGEILAGLVTAGSAVRRVVGVLIAGALLFVPLAMKSLPPASYQVTLTLAFIHSI